MPVHSTSQSPTLTHASRDQTSSIRKDFDFEVPAWLAQPQFVADEEKNAPRLELLKPSLNRLTMGGVSRQVPFAAYDLTGPAAEAFRERPTPKGCLEAERKDPSGNSIELICFSHTVCNSVGHALSVHALNGTSNHGIIDTDGTVHQLVDLNRKAFSAGPHNERLVGFTFQNPVDPRVSCAATDSESNAHPLLVTRFPRHEGLYHCWGITDAQTKTAGRLVTWLAAQPEFDITEQVADFSLTPKDDAAVEAEFGKFQGAVGLYQLRPQHIAPGFDAMKAIAASLDASDDLADLSLNDSLPLAS
jgi:hypothetical protein